MRIDVVTGFPRLFTGPLTESMLNRAQDLRVAEIVVHDLRDYAVDKHRTIDDTPFGGGAGMVMKPEPVFACIEALKKERQYDEVIYLTPDGERFTQPIATSLSLR